MLVARICSQGGNRFGRFLPFIWLIAVCGASQTPVNLICSSGGQNLTAGSGTSGTLVASVDAPPTNELLSVSVCKFVVGAAGSYTRLWNLVADGDPTSTYLILYGEFDTSWSSCSLSYLKGSRHPLLLPLHHHSQTGPQTIRKHRFCASTGAPVERRACVLFRRRYKIAATHTSEAPHRRMIRACRYLWSQPADGAAMAPLFPTAAPLVSASGFFTLVFVQGARPHAAVQSCVVRVSRGDLAFPSRSRASGHETRALSDPHSRF